MLRYGATTLSQSRKLPDSTTKRKACDDNFSSLEENIKRFRITSTPGELRSGGDGASFSLPSCNQAVIVVVS
jgi:hypothetical protein